MKRDINYIARWSPSQSRGVIGKINNTVSALRRNGFSARSIIIEGAGFKGHIELALKVMFSKSDLLIVRATAYSMPLLFIPMLWQRLLGRKLVIDVPTPLHSVVREVDVVQKSKLKKIAMKFMISLGYPLSLYPANKIVQYSDEAVRYSFGLRYKTVISSNGIDVNALPVRRLRRCDAMAETVIVGVAALEDWHGYDRVIEGLSNYYSEKKDGRDVRFIVVGSGGVENRLKEMVKNLGLETHVSFTGTLVGSDLDEVFAKADVCVSSLAIHRKGLSKASDLKTREYMSRGFPVIISAKDPDLEDGLPFVHRVPVGDQPIDIFNVLRWLADGVLLDVMPEDINKYAFRKFDFSKKVNVYSDVLM